MTEVPRRLTCSLRWGVASMLLFVAGLATEAVAQSASPVTAGASVGSSPGEPAVGGERVARKLALQRLIEQLRMDPHPAATLAARLELGQMAFEDRDYATSQLQLQRAVRSIELLRAQHADALHRWPQTQWLDEAQLMLAESLHHLQRLDEAGAAYTALIERLHQARPPKPAVMSRALHNGATLAWEQRDGALALQRIEESAEQALLVPGIAPQMLADNLAAVVRVIGALPAANDSGRRLARVLKQAGQADLAHRLPDAYLRLLDDALAVSMSAGDLSAAQLLAETSGGAIAHAAAAPGLQLALQLRRLELEAQRGDEVVFRDGWDALRASAAGLPADQRQVFAERALRLAWASLMPVMSGFGHQGGRAYRARETTELASGLLLPLLPPEHALNRLARLQQATWQLMTLDTPSARPAFEGLLAHDAGTPEDAALRAFSTFMLAWVHALQHHNTTAIALGKEALNAFQALPQHQGADCAQMLCVDVARIALVGTAAAHRWLVARLIEAGRLSEAQQLLQMLREQELAESLRWGGAPQAGTGAAALTGLEQDRLQAYHRLRARHAALAQERRSLQELQAAGRLDAGGAVRLQQIGRLEAEELRPALARFLEGLDSAMAAGADRAVVQNSPSVRIEATQIQRDIDRWAREAPQSHAVGVQYLVDRDTLSIVVTVPDQTPLAHQAKLPRSALYDAVHGAQTLLRTPDSGAPQIRAALQKLHELLLAPIEGALRQVGARTLLLSLDDQLRQLPFAALVGADGRYLAEDYAIALYNEGSPQVLASDRSRDWHVAAMGASKAVGSLPALATVPAELAQVVRASRNGGETFLDARFTRTALDEALARAAAKPFNVLHLASHFVLQPGDANASTLILGDGSAISLAEMLRRPFNFRGFELVVYSACETGIAGGRLANGMEMESLSALTRRQGAAAVLGTLWKVSDASVADAMAGFYSHSARAGDSLAENLRQTQLAMLRGGSLRHRHPFHWAPFVLMGNWR